MPNESGNTTVAIQRYLDDLAGLQGNSPAEPLVRELLERAAQRLQLLCATMLYRSYPRLTRGPLNLQSDEMLSAVVERLIKAMRSARPSTVRQFFGVANQHMRWELNDLARRLDEQSFAIPLRDELVPAPESTGSEISPVARRLLEAIESLPEDEREVFSLVRIQGIKQIEIADLVGVSAKTVQRRLNRALLLLSEKLVDLRPAPRTPKL